MGIAAGAGIMGLYMVSPAVAASSRGLQQRVLRACCTATVAPQEVTSWGALPMHVPPSRHRHCTPQSSLPQIVCGFFQPMQSMPKVGGTKVLSWSMARPIRGPWQAERLGSRGSNHNTAHLQRPLPLLQPIFRYPLSYMSYHTFSFIGFMRNEVGVSMVGCWPGALAGPPDVTAAPFGAGLFRHTYCFASAAKSRLT